MNKWAKIIYKVRDGRGGDVCLIGDREITAFDGAESISNVAARINAGIEESSRMKQLLKIERAAEKMAEALNRHRMDDEGYCCWCGAWNEAECKDDCSRRLALSTYDKAKGDE